ncbi:MAG: hypothetical protein QME94_12990, partial [Anaerolineae bacterium]|nr:hypothetical protein [Anaerolineae bacterium]
MAAGAIPERAAGSPGNALVLREMQSEGILLVLPGLYAVSLVLFGVAGGMPTVERGFLPGILLLLLLAAVGALRRVHYL